MAWFIRIAINHSAFSEKKYYPISNASGNLLMRLGCNAQLFKKHVNLNGIMLWTLQLLIDLKNYQ